MQRCGRCNKVRAVELQISIGTRAKIYVVANNKAMPMSFGPLSFELLCSPWFASPSGGWDVGIVDHGEGIR